MSEEALPFVVGRKPGRQVFISIPSTAAIITIMFLGGSRHHPAACSVVGELAMVLSDSQLEKNLDAGAMLDQGKAVIGELSDNRHKPVKSRFMNDGTCITGFIHPMELYAMGLSAEGFLEDLSEEEEPTIYHSLETWSRGASRFVEDREMLAIYEREGTA